MQQAVIASSKRILIVEDVESTRRRLTTLLGSEGYHVDEAGDGIEGLRKFSATPYDAVLLDLVMPRANGWQFRETALRDPRLSDIPTVVLTARPLREPDRYVLRTPFVLSKPFEDATVLATMRQACAVQRIPGTAHELRPSQYMDEGLFWSKRGEVACAAHAPTGATARWQDERWSPVQRVGTRVTYQCQHCGSGPIAKPSSVR